MNIINGLIAYFALAAKSKWVVWWLLAPAMGVIILFVEREILFNENLFDVERQSDINYCSSGPEAERMDDGICVNFRQSIHIECTPETITARTVDGTCNNLDDPAWGSVGRRFGRNIDPATLPATVSDEEILSPNPRKVSLELMTREEFIPAKGANILVTAWVQFMIHDWFDHGLPESENPIKVPLADNDPAFDGEFLEIKRTKKDTTYDPALDSVVTFRNQVTHWWDGSQIYGSDLKTQNSLRTFRKGRMILDYGQLPHYFDGEIKTGFNSNWWVGLTLMHTIFVREHNRIARMLSRAYPEMRDQEIFDKARLINAALMAKIHTLEWTKAILNNPVLHQGLEANWNGLGEGPLTEVIASVKPYAEAISEMFGSKKVLDIQKMGVKAINGIVGGVTDSYGVPFSLTEEFVSVYRMHQLLPDTFEIRSIRRGRRLDVVSLEDTREKNAQKLVNKFGLVNIAYSLGISNPGALTLFNYPKAMQNIKIPFVGEIDLAAVDIIRDRERGVPRYNDFRAGIRLKPVETFEDFFRHFPGDTLQESEQQTADKLRDIYGTVDKIDLMVGMMAEGIRPNGFIFGETAFQIFSLMATRRLLSDRFYTEDYRAEIYTQEGLDWVATRGLANVLQDSLPRLNRDNLIPENPFFTWNEVSRRQRRR